MEAQQLHLCVQSPAELLASCSVADLKAQLFHWARSISHGLTPSRQAGCEGLEPGSSSTEQISPAWIQSLLKAGPDPAALAAAQRKSSTQMGKEAGSGEFGKRFVPPMQAIGTDGSTGG